ncbi:MAG: phosphoribosylamine--glycine ligase [bacterium]|nr:phosphoribosylamine--glycine ligase [bacterium]
MNGNMRILIVGGGGREHALAWACKKSPLVERVYVTPGNGGIAQENRRNVQAMDFDGIVRLAQEECIDLVVVGPEAPLVAGLVDYLEAAGIKAFGPSARAARLEGSKIYMKGFCADNAIPTAAWRWAGSYVPAANIISVWRHMNHGVAPVIKADGLCGGKGAVVPKTLEEALDAARAMLRGDAPYGAAGARIVIEDKLIGPECSIMALCAGLDYQLLPLSRDHKRARSGDKGPNTGGMGGYSPLPYVDEVLKRQICERIIEPTLFGMTYYENAPFYGMLYANLMLTADGPYVLEFNVRFADPETQFVLPRIKTDIVPYLFACTEPHGHLAGFPELEVSSDVAVGYTLTERGYPGKVTTGHCISGIEADMPGTLVFHAGTEWDAQGLRLVTSGARVATAVGLGPTFPQARERASARADAVSFTGKYRRKDF